MADQSIPRSSPHDQQSKQLPPEWQQFMKELLRRVADLESRVNALENP